VQRSGQTVEQHKFELDEIVCFASKLSIVRHVELKMLPALYRGEKVWSSDDVVVCFVFRTTDPSAAAVLDEEDARVAAGDVCRRIGIGGLFTVLLEGRWGYGEKWVRFRDENQEKT